MIKDDSVDFYSIKVVLSAPANDQSGTGSADAPATTVGAAGCEFDTCPPGSPATGFNASDRKLVCVNQEVKSFYAQVFSPLARLNYVNSFPSVAFTQNIRYTPLIILTE